MQEGLVVASIVDQRTHHVLREQLRHLLTAKPVGLCASEGVVHNELHGIASTHETKQPGRFDYVLTFQHGLGMMVKPLISVGFYYIWARGQLSTIPNEQHGESKALQHNGDFSTHLFSSSSNSCRPVNFLSCEPAAKRPSSTT